MGGAMGDPTGISGYVVSKVLDEVISQTKNTINCRSHCETLRKTLENIQPLVTAAGTAATASPPKDRHTDSNGRVVSGPSAVKKWLEDLVSVLKEAGALVRKCDTISYNIWSRNKMARQILSITEKIESVSVTQAPLAALAVMEETLRIVHENSRLLAEIRAKQQVQVNIRAVGGTTQEILRTKGIQPGQAFLEIRSRTDRFAASVHSDSGQSSHQNDHVDDERSSFTLRPVPGKTFGMDGPLAKLQDLLLDESRDIKWVGVHGKGGIGKTLLAEQVYNSEGIRDHFQNGIFWLTVGRSPSIERLLKKLCDMLDIRTHNFYSNEEAKTKIFNELRGKRVLLVLDDVWEDDGLPILDWFDVTAGWESGSKILVTTRNIQVLERKHAQDESTVRVERLSDNDSWELFCEFAFGGIGNIPATLEKLGRAVADECKGLPLALKVIAGAQAGQRAPDQWQRSLNKLKEAEVLNIDHQEQLYNRLQLSYDSLEFLDPDHRHRLQKCFIYFAGFAEDSDVDMEKLVKLWAGEKLFEAGDDTEDDTDPSLDGNYVLGVLIGRSLIDLQPTKLDNTNNLLDSFKLKCRVHDVLRDLARHLIRQGCAPMECLFTAGEGLKKFPKRWLTPIRSHVPELLGPKTNGLARDATHLSFNDNLLESLPTKLKAPKLEVLLLANNSGRGDLVISPGFFESFSSLKVLDLEYTKVRALPESLEKLKDLVYLNLSGTRLSKLPRGLRKLIKLETLNLQGCSDMEPWPFDISSLKSLSSLNTRDCTEIWGPKLPPKLGCGGSKTIFARDSLDNLCSLTGLRSLSITVRDRESLPSKIAALVNLRHLTVFMANLTTLPTTLQTSTGPKLSKLQYLSLDLCQALSELPSWIDSLPQLLTLDFVCCRQLRSLPNLHQLQELQKLDMTGCTGLQELPSGFASATAFPSLQELCMSGCTGLQEFPAIEEGAFPQLILLELNNCQFQTLPRSLSLLPNLEKLNLNRCMQLKSLNDCFTLHANDSRDPSSQQPQTVPFFRNLRDLGLRGGPLENLPCDLAACPSLRTIDLRDRPRDSHVTIPGNLQILQQEGKLSILGTPA